MPREVTNLCIVVDLTQQSIKLKQFKGQDVTAPTHAKWALSLFAIADLLIQLKTPTLDLFPHLDFVLILLNSLDDISQQVIHQLFPFSVALCVQMN